jgi:hypothetical protein
MNRCHRSLPLPIPYKKKDHIRSSTSPKSQPLLETYRLGCRCSVPLALPRLDAPSGSTPNFEPYHDCSAVCSPLWFSHDRFLLTSIVTSKQRPACTASCCCCCSTSAKRGRKALWPYVPYDTMAHPYAPDAYDKKVPPGYMRNIVTAPNTVPLTRASSTEARYTATFSDENPNACSVM